MINIVLFGKPGAGKGTQAEFLKNQYELVHISTGDIFRSNIKNATDLGKLAQSFMDKGDLVPDSVTIKMLEAEVEKTQQPKDLFLTVSQELQLRQMLWILFTKKRNANHCYNCFGGFR